MKKLVSLLLVLCLAAQAAAWAEEAGLGPVCSADEALAWAKENGVVVMENMKCTAHQTAWDTFAASAEAGRRASVLCAMVYLLDCEIDPQLFFYRVDFDGQIFTVSTRRSTDETAEASCQFTCLNHFVGKAPSHATFSRYEYYMLMNRKVDTWEEVMARMLSSQATEGEDFRYYTVYENTWD